MGHDNATVPQGGTADMAQLNADVEVPVRSATSLAPSAFAGTVHHKYSFSPISAASQTHISFGMRATGGSRRLHTLLPAALVAIFL